MPPKLVFVVPVRHPDSVRDWSTLKPLIARTLGSIAAQTGGAWEARVVANPGTDLPAMPPGCREIEADLPLPVLPDRDTAREAYYEAVRTDKGLRILAGMEDLPDDCHVMVVDYDDFVSRDLAAHVARHPVAPGWYVDQGYSWAGGPWIFKMGRLHTRCGTCLIVRRDLFGSFRDATGAPDLPAVRRRLGSHVFLKDELAARGEPLVPLPFRGAVYRIGHAQATSGSKGLFAQMTPLGALRRGPLRWLRQVVMCYRPVTAEHRQAFGLGG